MFLILAALSLCSCSQNDPKQALRDSLQQLVSAVEEKKHRAVTNKLVKNFRGNGRFNQQTMSALVFRYYVRHKFIKIYTLINSIEIKSITENNAKAKMIFHAALTSSKKSLPEHMRVFKIDSRWEIIDKEWKMSTANWIEVRPQSVYPQMKELIISLNNVSGEKDVLIPLAH